MNRFLLTSVSVVSIGFGSAALAAGGGSIYLTQTGDSQNASIDQSGGTGNTVGALGTPFLQENGGGTGSNVIVINQNAGTNSVLPDIGDLVAPGSGNAVTGFQSGTANNAEIDQMGSGSSVNLQQTGKGNGPTGPGGGNPWFNGTSGNLILQDATTNLSTVSLIQTNSVNATNGNVFNIGQGGYSNDVVATQTGQNKLWIRQGSTEPDLWSWTWGNPFDPANTPGSLGPLSNSTMTVNQSVGGANPAQRNYAALGQGNGNNNLLTVTQTGGSNSVDANQIGSNNVFSSTQSSTNANASWNFIGGEAGWPGGIDSPWTGRNGDFGPITQTGNNNMYVSVQSGTSQMAFGYQLGNFNSLSSVQSGDQNTLFSTQDGDDNDIVSVQDGDLNLATVTQNNNGSLTNLVQDGSSNVASILQ